jgi:PIN domain nuclease of toxin-antitoxin system
LRLLLDTNALVWTLLGRRRLSPAAVEAIEDPANEVFVSVVSAWEIEIKMAKGKLPMPEPLGEALVEQRFESLPVTLRHVLAVEALPRHHRDPFDRMLIAQAQLERMTLVSADRKMRDYPVSLMSAT